MCPAAANASPACTASACTLLCASGFSDCDGQAANGCEVNLATSLTSCGACGRVCAAGANQQAQCSSGACQRSCTAGFGNCDGQAANGCEANLATTVTQCGACGRVCAAPVGGTATCVAGACGGACAAGQTVCGATGGSAGRCVSLQADAANCGACGNACPSGQSCVAGACRMLCPSGQTACGSTMSCVDLATSAANCGFCGRACASGESCVFGTCLAPFRLGTLATTGCNVVNNEAVNGDQRGNVTVGATRVLVNADNGTGTFDGANVAAAPSMVPTYLDGAVYDTFSGELYLLGDGAGPVRFGTGTRNVDRLWRTQSGVWIVNAPRLLSRSIALDTNGTGVGVYSGGNRAVVHTSNVYSINLTTGAVTDLGAMPQPPRTGAENFRSTGIAEYSGTTLYLTYIQSASTIARVRVPDGLVTSVGSFANLGDAAHLAVYSNGAASRWLLRVEGVSQFGLVAEALVSCPVTVAQNVTTGQFTVGGYAVAGCTVVDTNPLVGDDRGPLAVSYGQVFIAGDAGSARYAAASPAASNGLAVGQFGDHLLYNVRDGALFGLYSGAVPLQSSQGLVTVDRIVPLNESSLQPSGAALTLSQPLVVNTSAYSNVMLFNGWDRSVLVTNGHAWNINLDNGDVRDFGAAVLPAHIAAEQWAAVGIAETTGSATDLVFVESATRISRMRLGTGTLGSVLSLTNLGDTNSLGFSRARGRWYWQTEGTNQFTPATFAEYVGGCPGTFSN